MKHLFAALLRIYRLRCDLNLVLNAYVARTLLSRLDNRLLLSPPYIESYFCGPFDYVDQIIKK